MLHSDQLSQVLCEAEMADAHQISSLCQRCLLWYSILTTVFSACLRLGKLACKSRAELRTVAESLRSLHCWCLLVTALILCTDSRAGLESHPLQPVDQLLHVLMLSGSLQEPLLPAAHIRDPFNSFCSCPIHLQPFCLQGGRVHISDFTTGYAFLCVSSWKM